MDKKSMEKLRFASEGGVEAALCMQASTIYLQRKHSNKDAQAARTASDGHDNEAEIFGFNHLRAHLHIALRTLEHTKPLGLSIYPRLSFWVRIEFHSWLGFRALTCVSLGFARPGSIPLESSRIHSGRTY
ncbi:hypothetical protein CRG98_043122 [Punica granatum]|uniref:Uncharacterized protein n=1 Tax=Punica granatum TaxID=22663 RepID=A0A2I0HXQ4_PUNGR|nr:hypothetical protein CRG98_043122 [Punica granatum]